MNMEMQRKSLIGSGTGKDGSRRAVVTVGLPQPHEGIGNALRATFRARRESLPDDMMELLNKLDRH